MNATLNRSTDRNVLILAHDGFDALSRVLRSRRPGRSLMMRNLRKALGVVGVVAGFTSLATMLTVGCSGDDNNDGGTDSGPDVTTEGGKDVQNDVIGNDVTDGGGGDVDAGDPVAKFRDNTTNAFCAHFQTCCNGLDAGTFDMAHCLSAGPNSAWNGSNYELAKPGVLQRGNVTLNETAATSCLAGIATLSCPTITSSETLTATDNCYAATTGKLTVGSNCVASVECQPTAYCKFAGVDAGTTDGGIALGVCTALAGDGGACGAAPYGDPNFLSNECAYKGWHSPAQFCDYDSYPTGPYTCAPLRANGATCYFDNECASGICGTTDQDCLNTTCTCNTTRDYTQFCRDFAIKDAGTD